jgi:hypothetical protein
MTDQDREGNDVGSDDWLAEQFEAHRGRLRAVAYRMLGSLAEADDAVQVNVTCPLRIDQGDLPGAAQDLDGGPGRVIWTANPAGLHDDAVTFVMSASVGRDRPLGHLTSQPGDWRFVTDGDSSAAADTRYPPLSTYLYGGVPAADGVHKYHSLWRLAE